MSDNHSPTPDLPADPNRSGGVNITAQGNVQIGGGVVGRDKTTTNIDTGGAYVEGDVNVASGGTFIGRDSIQKIRNVFIGDKAQRDLRNRSNMLQRVKNDWVRGVLEKSLHHEVMLDLGLEERPDEVQHPWDMALQMPDRENRILPSGTKILQVFDEMNHSLLILGEPGSGKTTMLLELARDTIARAEQDPLQPIPVVFNLSAWSADPKQSIASWLVKELDNKYDVQRKTAQPWIDNDDLLLLLDGLDEVKPEYRKMCINAINDFRREHGQTHLVMCSRIADYEVLATRLRLSGAVLVQPLTAQQVDDYLDRGGNELMAVRRALKRDAHLQGLARSPLMLGIMSLVYSGQSADRMIAIQGDTAQRHVRLFDAYVDNMFVRVARAKYEPYSKGDTVRWLAWLAAKMSEHGRTVFLVEQMQPSWLQTHGQRMIFFIGDGLVLGLVVGLVIGLFGEPLWGLGGGLLGMLVGGVVAGLGDLLFGEPFGEPAGMVAGGVVGGLLGGVLGGLIGEAVIGSAGDLDLVLEIVLIPALIVLLYLKGFDSIRRARLRFILWRNGNIPSDYARFLNYAADRIFLRKVGGGYIFIHRMLMEYFASLETQPSAEGNE